MSYRDHLTRYGQPTKNAEMTVYLYWQAPESLSTSKEVAYRDKSAAAEIERFQNLIADLQEYRQALAARYAELETMPYTLELSLTRENRSYSGIKYYIQIIKKYSDGTQIDELSEVYPGKERHTALKRFEELKKQRPGIAAVKKIDKAQWER